MIDAYAAGLIDGEGCVYVDKTFTVRVDMGMTVKALPLLLQMKQTYGGSLSKFRDETDRWQEAWTWRIFGPACETMLVRLLPEFQLKGEQVRLALRVQDIQRQMTSAGTSRARWTPEQRQRVESIRLRIMELNRKGPHQEKNWGPNVFAHRVGGTWVTHQRDLFSDLGYETFSGPWPTSGWLHNGACSTVATTEWPRDGGGSSCSLVDILENPADVPGRFSLSPKAAAGILRRAKRRGRTLPTALQQALADLAMGTATLGIPPTSPQP